MFERPKSGESAVLVHVTFKKLSSQVDFREFCELAMAAGAQTVAKVSSTREQPDPRYFIGSGKLKEISQIVKANSADLVIFDNELSPAQERNIEKFLQCRVLSRTGLILDIFAQRARTYEGKLQVELAQLKHLATRLVRGWTHLERQKGGIGLRGPGETQLETDRRLIRQRITRIESRLEQVRKRRNQSRKQRSKAEVPTIALVGYTNAGKSTLFNKLTQADVLVENKLFATLDPTLRKIEIDGIGPAVLVDTVGFVRKLPHNLIEAFRATLEETVEADILIHVVDGHDPCNEETMFAVNEVLTEIGANEVFQIVVFNKADLLLESDPKPGEYETGANGCITKLWLSALTGEGIDLLLKALQGRLSLDSVEGELILEPNQGELRSQLHAVGAIVSEQPHKDGGWEVKIKIARKKWNQLCAQHGARNIYLKVN